MAANPLNAAYDNYRKPGELIDYDLSPSNVVYKGSLVCLLPNTAQLVPAADTAGLTFAGVAYEGCTRGGKRFADLRVFATGTYLFDLPSGTTADSTYIGKRVCAYDDHTVALPAAVTNNITVGFVVGIDDNTGRVRVRLGGLVG